MRQPDRGPTLPTDIVENRRRNNCLPLEAVEEALAELERLVQEVRVIVRNNRTFGSQQVHHYAINTLRTAIRNHTRSALDKLR